MRYSGKIERVAPEERVADRRQLLQTAGLVSVLAFAATAGAVEGVIRFSGSEADTGEGIVAEMLKGDAPLTSALAKVDSDAGSAAPVWDLPNLDHPRVDYWVERFRTDKRDEFARFLRRSGRYVPMISAKLEERGMPQDLVYLAMIESGFNPKAYSRAHASGLWQFISGTAARYGLDMNRAVDERNDPVKATDAALDYLTYLHNRFGSWYLAAAGYNTGENRVARIMRQVTGSERGKEEDYYRIWSRLPRETRDYVPLMVAAARISKSPAEYGFGDVELEAPLVCEEVIVELATPLSAVAQASGTTVEKIRELNPHFKLNRTRNDMRSPVRLPVGGAARFAANWEAVKTGSVYAQAAAEARTTQYRVRRGDNLSTIARRHGVSVSAIRRANGLRGDRIIAGAVLRIPPA